MLYYIFFKNRSLIDFYVLCLGKGIVLEFLFKISFFVVTFKNDYDFVIIV